MTSERHYARVARERTRRRFRIAVSVVAAGGVLACLGLAMLWLPLGIIAAGAGLVALGLFAVEVTP